MPYRDLLESMSKQIGGLVHHVAEVRQSNLALCSQMRALRAEMQALRADVDALRAAVDALRADVEGLRADVDALRADVEALRADVDTLRAEVKTLRTDVDALRMDGDTLRADMEAVRSDIRKLDQKIDEKTDFLAGKIQHFITYFSGEIAGDRARSEEDRYLRDAQQKKTEKRLDDIERRLVRLEAAFPA